jgi:parallel beta-helix repeat protein
LNFGIGLTVAGVNNNVIEDNTIFGNANGIVLVPGIEGNIIRRNLVTGNPPLDSPSIKGVDIGNGATAGANAFEGNVCLTSINAPCPSVGVSLTASPNPVPVTGSALLGATTISWIAPGLTGVEVHIGSPDGPLFAAGGERGSATTGLWLTDGLTFYLQDVTGGKLLTADNTLATLVVLVQKM